MEKEILKSVLYGGLTELITSFGIVTSASSTGASTGKIIGLSLTNLLTGVFVMTYKIAEQWVDGERGNNEAIEEEVDVYEELFGDRHNHRLHLTLAILSFLFFGLVPPLVYGFTFRKPENKVLKISAVTVVSTLFLGFLGVAKAYISRPQNFLVYAYIIGGCIIDALGTSVLTTFGGELIENYIQQAGWFDFQANKLYLPANMGF